jgi:hypothetical protein
MVWEIGMHKLGGMGLHTMTHPSQLSYSSLLCSPLGVLLSLLTYLLPQPYAHGDP